MTALKRPRGLIDYDSWRKIERGHRGETRVSRLIRPKTIALSVACVALAARMALMFAVRTRGSISVQHDRSPLAVALSDGSVRNAYTVKLLNKSATPHAFVLMAEGPDATLAIVGGETGQPVAIAADSSVSVRVTLTMAQPQNADVRFVATDVSRNEVLSALDRFVTQ